MPRLFFALFFAVLLLHGAAPAFACSCAGPGLPEAAFKQAKAVFAATVTVTKRAENNLPMEFRLTRGKSWKGDAPDVIMLGMPMRGCEMWNFEDGAEYLVYAGEEFGVSSCSRTKLLKRAGIEAEALDAIVAGKAVDFETLLPPALLTASDEYRRAEAAALMREVMSQGPGQKAPDSFSPALLKAAQDKSAVVRLAAVQTLGSFSLGTAAGVKEALVAALADEDRQVRSAAVGTFGMVSRSDTKVFRALVAALQLAHKDPNPDHERQESLLYGFARALAESASNDAEKDEAVTLLQGLIDEISNSYSRVGPIQHLGFMGARAKKAAPQLLQVLKTTDNDHVKQYTIIALGDIGATEAQDVIEPYLKNDSCYISQAVIQAVWKMNKDGFAAFYADKAMPEMKARFDKCATEYVWGLQAMVPAGREMEPFITEKYNAMEDADWKKGVLKTLLDTWKNAAP